MNLKQTIKFSFKRQRVFFLLILIYMLVIYLASMPIAYYSDESDITFSLHIFASVPVFLYILLSAKDLIFSAIANGVSRKTAIIANICVWAIFAVVLSCVCIFSETAISCFLEKYSNASPVYNGEYVNEFENDIKYYAVYYTDDEHKEKTEISEKEYKLYRYNPEIHKDIDERCGKNISFEKYVPAVSPAFRTIVLNILYAGFKFMRVIAFAWFCGIIEIIISFSGYTQIYGMITAMAFALCMLAITFGGIYVENNILSGNVVITFISSVIKSTYDFRSFVYSNLAFALLWKISLSFFWTALALWFRKFVRATQTKFRS